MDDSVNYIMFVFRFSFSSHYTADIKMCSEGEGRLYIFVIVDIQSPDRE